MSKINFPCKLKDLYAIKHALEASIKNKEERIMLSKATPEIAMECAKYVGGAANLATDPTQLHADVDHEKGLVDSIVEIINRYSNTTEHYSDTDDGDIVLYKTSINCAYTSVLTEVISKLLDVDCALTHDEDKINTLSIRGICRKISQRPFDIGFISYDINCVITDIVLLPIRYVTFTSFPRDKDVSELNKFIGKKLVLYESEYD